MYLVDSDILIDALRGHAGARDFLRKHMGVLAISVLSVAELHAGARNKKEEKQLAGFLSLFSCHPVGIEIAHLGGHYRQRYGKSHGTGLVDAMIAATTQLLDIPLVTRNKKHYPMLDTVYTPYGDE